MGRQVKIAGAIRRASAENHDAAIGTESRRSLCVTNVTPGYFNARAIQGAIDVGESRATAHMVWRSKSALPLLKWAWDIAI